MARASTYLARAVSKKTPTPAESAADRLPVVFKVNTITDGKLLLAGEASPWFAAEEVPERLRPFIGEPSPPPVDPEAWAAETERLQLSLTGDLPESVKEALEERNSEAHHVAQARASMTVHFREEKDPQP
jgi:hypothetical protein